MPTIATRDRKLAEMILFISEKSEGDARFGAVKLNKLMFYSDFLTYLTLGRSVTGQKYQKLPNGPAPRRLLPVRTLLVERGELAIRKTEYFNKKQDRTFALRPPVLSCFSGDEIALITEIIQHNWEHNASQISHLSHQFHGWEDAADGDVIPYEIALLSKRIPSPVERRKCLADANRARALLSGERKATLVNAKTLSR